MFITSTWYVAICTHNQLIITRKMLQEMSWSTVQLFISCFSACAAALTGAPSQEQHLGAGQETLSLNSVAQWKIKTGRMKERNANNRRLVTLTASARPELFFYRPLRRPFQG